MTTTVVVHFYAKPGEGAKLRDAILPAMPRLRRLHECVGASLYHDIDAPDTVVLIEHWTSADAHKAYVARVESDGTMDPLRPLLDQPVKRRYLEGV